MRNRLIPDFILSSSFKRPFTSPRRCYGIDLRQVKRKMVANGGVPPRGSAAAAASLRRRRAGGGGAATGGVNTMLQFYTDSVTGWKLTPFSVLIMSTSFIAFVAVLHGVGKFLRA